MTTLRLGHFYLISKYLGLNPGSAAFPASYLCVLWKVTGDNSHTLLTGTHVGKLNSVPDSRS